MRTTCLWILSMFLIHSSFAQMKEPVNSGELLKKAVKLHDENKFKEAVALFRQIPRNDTNYVLALYEQALSLQADSNYPAALQAVRLGLETGDEDQELLLLTLRASIVDDTGNTAGAVALYDSALMKYPRAQNLRLNKAVSLMRLNKYTDAEKLLQQILVSNPYYSSAHFRLGQCALQRGDLIPALMCFYTYLLNSPAGPYSQASIKLLGNISKGLDDVRELVAQRTAGPSGNLALVEQIVLSKIAMDKGYKVKTELDDPIIRQLQVLMEKLEYDAESDNFYMQFYVPYLTDIFRQGLFEPAVYRAFNDVDIEIIQRYNKKNQKQISAATSVIITSLQSIHATGELNFNKRKSLSALNHYDDGQLIGKGRLENDKTVGAWEFYYTNGNLKSSGMYNAQGLKVGTWNYYTATGKVLGVDNWKEGKQEGEDLIYNLQGVLQTKAQYQNGKLQGERFTYHVPGHLNVASDFKQGVEEGTFRQFYDNGRKKIVAGSQNDQLHGAYRSYFISGQLESEAQYQQGKLHGTYKSYHENGQLEFETSYQNGELNGLTKTYHDNGKLLRTITYVNNLAEGEEVKYYKDGTIEEKSNYKKVVVSFL